ncbi:MAG: FHA domain-containing protein [Phycisphaerales bacterium]|nr:FHA domain-containing protein [Phycisphaerales bacterium]
MPDFWLISPPGNKDVKFQLVQPGPLSIGRETSCSIVLADRSVSRQHASLQWTPPINQEPGSWRVTDLGSAGGTFVNGVKLQAARSLALCHGDQIEIAPWNFDFIDQQSPVNMSRTVVMSGGKENSQENSNIERVNLSAPAVFAHNQLLLLLESEEAIHKAMDESSVYQALVNAAAKSTQFENVAFVRSTGEGEAVEVLAQVGNIQDPSGKTRMSRTMLRQARQGPVVAKANEAMAGGGIAMSLQGMDVRCAICIPVELSGMRFGFLYLDDRKQCDDATLTITASVAGSVARMAAQNLGNQQRVRMEQRFAMEQQLMFEGIMQVLISLFDARDRYTAGHSERVAAFSKLIAEAANLDAEMIKRTHMCGMLHDIGKLGVPESVLFKPTRLTEDEFAQIAKHPETGHKCLSHSSRLNDVLPGVIDHHEKWDGTGYPHKLVGDNISVLGRILCIADAFDAMTSTRAYRPAIEVGKVLAEIEKSLGSHFDPEFGKVFLSIPRVKLEEIIATNIKPKASE